MRADVLHHTVRDAVPDALERGQTSTVYAEFYLEGVLTAPDSGTVSVVDANGEEVTSGAVTMVDSIARRDVAIDADATLGELYRVDWVLSVGGQTYRVSSRAEVVRRRLTCPIAVVDLYQRLPALDPSDDNASTNYTTADYAAFIREAWVWCLTKLRATGKRPDVVSSADALRETVLARALANVYGALVHHYPDRFQNLFDTHVASADRQYRMAHIEFAPDDAETARSRTTNGGPVWFMGV